MKTLTPNQTSKKIAPQSYRLFKRVIKNFAPPENILVSVWSNTYRQLSPESSSETGQWKGHRAPHLDEIMDCMNDDEVEEIVFMSCAQMGKSEVLNNIIGHKMHLNPGPIMMMQPSVKMAEDFSKDRIVPMCRDTNVLRKLIESLKGTEKNQTTLHKNFPGGHLTLVGSNSPASLASRPIQVLLVDEEDRTSVTVEGDSVALAKKRQTTFPDRKLVRVSTPTYKNVSKIEKAYNRTDKRKRFVECPSCNHSQTLVWKGVKWDTIVEDGKRRHLPDTARYECEKCEYKIYDGERYELMNTAKWIATAPFRGKAGFHINELYSKFRTLEEVVDAFLDAKDNPDTLKVFVNTVLGLPFEVKGAAPSWRRLYERREDYKIGTIPKGGIILVGGADVQGDRIHLEVVAYGRNLESWSVNNIVLHGDTSSVDGKVWRELDKEVQRTYKNAAGINIGLAKFCIDANYNTKVVHAWARKYASSRVYCVIGKDELRTACGVPYRVDLRKDRAYGLKCYPVGSSLLKEELYSFLRQNKPTEEGEGYPYGYCHFPQYDANFFKELTAEKQIRKRTKRGFTKYVWENTRDRNEALDVRVYARAACYLTGIDRFEEQDWLIYESNINGAIKPKSVSNTPVVRVQSKDEPKFWRD